MIAAAAKKLRMPPDTSERHAAIASLATPARSVLDVGGIRDELGLFMPNSEITTINMAGEDADATFDGNRLPFADKSFSKAVSLDVIEHIQHDSRAKHVSELIRVSTETVLVCCPLGSPQHAAAETELADWYQEKTGSEHHFLAEHLKMGLPTKAELTGLAVSTDLAFKLFFQGDFRKVNQAFRTSTLLRTNPGPASALAYARIRLDPRRDFHLHDSSSPHSNRVILKLELA